MSSSSGSGEITELLRRLGDTALLHEAESHGLSPRAGRMRCPWAACEHKAKDRERDAVVFAAQHPRVHCYACSTSGDLIDLLERTRGLSRAEAIAHLQGQPVPERPRPELRVVGTRPPDEAGKMEPAEVRRLWDSLVRTDALSRKYLEGRNLGEAVDAGLVRFATDAVKDKRVSGRASQGYRIGALVYDVVGQPRGLQLRLGRGGQGSDPTIVSVKGSVTSRAFFGQPGLIEGAAVIAVAEGFADTLALQLWAGEGAVVAGAAGKGVLHHLAGELEASGIDVTGKLFALFPQNDRPQNKSRIEFRRLSQLLTGRGARVCWVTTPEEHADLADWLKAKPDVAWPPPELLKAFGHQPGDEAAPVNVVTQGLAIAVPAQVTAERFAQNFTTLCALLDDPAHREAIMGQGELSWCEMTTRVKFGGKPITERDISTIRLGLESVARSTDNKPLQFGERDIEKALELLASRNPVHEVREWVRAATWDGEPRIQQLAVILGHAPDSFEARLLRRWVTSCVARVERPGCKADTVLILTGGQGLKKTTFFETLASEPWFTSSKVQPGDTDGLMIMREVWMVEWGELHSMRARNVETTKDFLSQRTDMFRRPYGRAIGREPRHCVIVGTSNPKEILEDPSGNRRFWPIEVRSKRIDVKWLQEHRAQLFAEALTIYRAGLGCPACRNDGDGRCSDHRWWLTDEEEAMLREHHKAFDSEDDVWTVPILHWLTDQLPLEVTTDQVLHLALEVKKDKLDMQGQRRVGGILQRLGWVKGKSRRHGSTPVNVYRRPEEAP